jgi:hypothetical protein
MAASMPMTRFLTKMTIWLGYAADWSRSIAVGSYTEGIQSKFHAGHRKNMSPSSSELKSKPSKKPA